MDAAKGVKLPEHYTMWKVEPVTFIMENDMPFAEGNVIKYVMRHRAKNGANDLLKAVRYIEMILEKDYRLALDGNPIVHHSNEWPDY
jgi:hypothetical protein